MVSGKLKGFASEGRDLKKAPVDKDGPDKDLLGQLDMPRGAEDSWADHSDSDSDSVDSSDDNGEHSSNDVGEEVDILTSTGTAHGSFPGGCPEESEAAPRHVGKGSHVEAEETPKDAAPGSEPGERGACAGTRESSTSTPAKPSSDVKAKEAAMSDGDNGAMPPDIPVRSDVPAS